jgi:dTMP kinase
MNNHGAFVVIEAIDQAGKTSVIDAVVADLRRRNIRVETVVYPDRAAPITGPLIVAYLSGASFANDPIIDTAVAQAIFALNRREVDGRLRRLLASSDVVIASRYALSGRVYAEACGLDRRVAAQVLGAIDGDLRQPDLTIVLDVAPSIAMARSSRSDLDRFDRNATLQQRVAAGFRAAAAADDRIVLVDATESVTAIADRVVDEIVSRVPLITR